jgi:MFS family permease
MSRVIETSASLSKKYDYNIWAVIGAAGAGTVIEWYDFYLFGSLASTVSKLFYGTNETLSLLLYLATFAVGFIVRPFGALFFGRIGDLVGRKYAFLVTLLIMGFSTFFIGLLPTYAKIGVAAPIILILIRILQGLALGGEYGGAAIYVAEHVPDNKRGFYTSFIQITATLGLFISLAVILTVQKTMSKEDFAAWGWRIPFLVSIILVGMSLYIRLRMKESPIFSTLKSEGKTSTAPIKEALGEPGALKRIALTLFGATAGQGVVWYCGQFYALYYLQNILSVDKEKAFYIIAAALVLGMPFFVVFGALSDRIGRKKVMMAGCFLAAVCYYPIYHGMVYAAGNNIVALTYIPDPVKGKEPKLAPMMQNPADPGGKLIPAKVSNPNRQQFAMLMLLVFVQVLFVTMVYGPIAAYLVEAFPARVRYTSLSLPYHIGNGVFGGMLPLIGVYSCAATGNLYAGLVYPIVIASMTFVVGSLFLKETRHVRIWDELT